MLARKWSLNGWPNGVPLKMKMLVMDMFVAYHCSCLGFVCTWHEWGATACLVTRSRLRWESFVWHWNPLRRPNSPKCQCAACNSVYRMANDHSLVYTWLCANTAECTTLSHSMKWHSWHLYTIPRWPTQRHWNESMELIRFFFKFLWEWNWRTYLLYLWNQNHKWRRRRKERKRRKWN